MVLIEEVAATPDAVCEKVERSVPDTKDASAGDKEREQAFMHTQPREDVKGGRQLFAARRSPTHPAAMELGAGRLRAGGNYLTQAQLPRGGSLAVPAACGAALVHPADGVAQMTVEACTEGATVLCPTASREGDRSGPPPRLAVEDPAGRKENGSTLPIHHVTTARS